MATSAEKPAPKRPGAAPVPKLDSDTFLSMAQQIVLDSFNTHRNPLKVPALLLGEINPVWFAKVLGGWKCIISSTVARGLLWEVTYASSKNEIYLDVYTKVNNQKINLEEDKAA
jgi:hypothetical protein